MKSICITGSRSDVGKTTLVSDLLSRLTGWAACKVTVCSPDGTHRCPRGRDDCGVCNSLTEDYVLEERPEILDEAGKDTRRYAEAGAEKVIWVKTKPAFLEQSVREAVAKLTAFNGILFEGNHVLQVYKPDVSVMLVPEKNNPERKSSGGTIRYKSSAKKILGRIDITANPKQKGLIEEIFGTLNAKGTAATEGDTAEM